MKLNKSFTAILLAGMSLSGYATTEPSNVESSSMTEQSANDVEITNIESSSIGEQSVKNVEVAVKDPADQIDEKISSYIQKVESSVAKAHKSHLIRFYSGTSSISIDKSDTEWANYRAEALNEAIFKARESYLRTLNRDSVRTEVRDYFKAKGLPEPQAEDFKNQSKIEQLLDKAVAVADGKLNKELKDMGINAKEFDAASPKKKQTLLKQYFGTKSITSAYGDLSGMFVTQTFEVIDENGKGSVGVVMALSATKRDKVVALIDSKGQVAADPQKANPNNSNLPAVFAAKKDTLFLKKGTELIYDAQGYPVLVAYGQAGVSYSSDSEERQIEREAAVEWADDDAWGALASTYNLSGDFSKESNKENTKIKENVFELAAGNNVRKNESGIQKNIMSTIKSSSTMVSSIKDMTGVSIEYKWRKPHPITGQEMVGVVLVWHPIKIRNAELMQSGKTAAEMDSSIAPTNNAIGATKTSSFSSEDSFNVSDF